MAVTRMGFGGSSAAYGTFEDKALGTAAARRGKRARGRSRKYGRALWWLVLVPQFWQMFS